MPVATNAQRFLNQPFTKSDREKYFSEVSFVGVTGYDNEYNTSKMDLKFSTETLIYLYSIFEDQKKCTYKCILRNFIDDSLVNLLKRESGLYFPISDDLCMNEKEKLTYLLGKKCNELERIAYIRTLSSKYTFKVYGDMHWKKFESNLLKYMGYAEHYFEMPKIFKASQINLNIIRAYVDNGLPMRIFDVLASQGFLVTNYREEIDEYFTTGKELIIYRDLQDLKEICAYYLNHESERQNIIHQGFEKVKFEHTFQNRLSKILKLVDKEFLLARLSLAQ